MQKILLNKNEISSLYIENLSASYGKTDILSNCSLSLKPGEFVCLCGPNGSGKSTLLSVLSALNDSSLKVSCKTEPSFVIKNEKTIPLSALSRKQTASIISVLQQDEYSTWDFYVKDYVLQGRFCYTENANYSKEDENIAMQAMKETGIYELKDRTIHSLSGGEFQKVRIARCLCQEPSFLLLDEPASSLDFVYEPKLMQQLKDLAKARNIGILLSIHDLNQAARFADRLVLIKARTPLITGTPESLFTEEMLSQIYNTNCKIFTHPVYNCPQVIPQE